MMIKVSVIIPIYNVEKYIEECLLSVMRQTLREIEIICVNDGTKDCSMDIVEKYAKEDNRIIIIYKENGGLSSARNKGIEVAKGEYLYFLDSDDYIAENMLEVLYGESQKYNLDNIYFDAEAFFENEKIEREQAHYKHYYRRPAAFEQVMTGPDLFALMENQKYYRPSACLQMPKRSLLVEQGISFYEGIVHEDQLFSLLVILSAKRTKHIAKPFYKRRVREESIMTGTKEFQNSYGYYVCLSEFKKFVLQNHFDKPELMIAIEHRIHQLQNLAVAAITDISYQDLGKELSRYPLADQIEYNMCVRRLVEEKQAQKAKLDSTKQNLEHKVLGVKKSASFRVGSALLAIPRKILHFVRNIKRNGIVCTFYAIKRKLTKEKRLLHPDYICVSIIIPMYNARKYLRECLDRLLCQTLQSIEIICVNDGSTDDTLQILQEYEEKDGRIHIVNQKNQGAGIARNNGMAIAQGEYYLFLDADDIFNEKLCEEAYYKAKYDMADIVLFEAYRYNVKTARKEEMNWVLREDLLPKQIPFSVKNTGRQIYQITTACPWSKMFRADFVKKQGLTFQNTKNANDVFFVRTALVLAKRITVLKKRLITYRYNDGDNLQSHKSKAPLEFYKAFKALKEELIRRGVYKKVEQSYVNMVLKESLFNLETTCDETAKHMIMQTLHEEGFDYFEFHKYNKSFFYNEEDYETLQHIL